MAQNQMQGLFKGPGVNDVYELQRQERDQKVRQAMADSAGAGGNFYANLQAKANEQMSQAFQGGVRGLLQGTDLAPAEDPRLASARKREGDRNEIIAMLSGYSEDGVITPDEMRLGYSELMRRGYPNEARKFLADAQGEELGKANTLKAQAAKAKADGTGVAQKWVFEKVTKHRDGEGNEFLRSIKKVKEGADAGDTVYEWTDAAGNDVDAPSAKGLVSLGDLDQTAKEEHTDKVMLIEKRRTEQETLARTKSDIKLTENQKIVWQGVQEDQRKLMPQFEAAMEKSDDLLLLLEKIETSGIDNMQLEIKSFFGWNDKKVADETAFNSGTKEYLTEILSVMGRNPTDFDVKFLEKITPNMVKTKSGNIRLLQLMRDHNQRKYDVANEMSRGDFTRKNWFEKHGIPSSEKLKEHRKHMKKLKLDMVKESKKIMSGGKPSPLTGFSIVRER